MVKSEQFCTNHECGKCGESLYTYSTKDKIITVLIMFFAMMIVVGGLTLLENVSQELCYERHYIKGRGTDLETIKNVDVKCPQ